jgi:hypothetical protein
VRGLIAKATAIVSKGLCNVDTLFVVVGRAPADAPLNRRQRVQHVLHDGARGLAQTSVMRVLDAA